MARFTGGDALTNAFEQKVHQIMMKNELQNGEGAYQLSYAAIGRSGFSFGGNQMDLSKNERARQTFYDIISSATNHDGAYLFREEEVKDIMHKVTTTHSPNAVKPYEERINQALSSSYGRQRIDAVYPEEIKNRIEHVDQVIESLPESTRASLKANDEVRLRLVDYHNQFGLHPHGTMQQFLAGEQVTIGSTVRDPDGTVMQLKEGRLPGVAELHDFVIHTKHGKEHPQDVVRRDVNIAHIAAEGALNMSQEHHHTAQLKEPFSHYTIQHGDTITDIAHKFGVGTHELLLVNPEIHDPNRIHAGNPLQLPESAAHRPITEEDRTLAKLCNREADIVQFMQEYDARRVSQSQELHIDRTLLTSV